MRNGESNSERPKADDFGRSVIRMAVAQICENVGFDGSKDSALDALSDIALQYICDLAKSATFNASLSGRAQCNFFDIVRGLEGMGSVSSPGSCLVGSGLVNELIEFLGSSEDVPFSHPIPRFPVVRVRRMIPSFEEMGEMPPGKHVPGWLPALPDPHTYVHTPVWRERVSDPRAEKIEQAKQRRKAERALLNLQQRLLSVGSSGASSSEAIMTDGDAMEVSLAESGEDDGHVAALPVVKKGNVSVMEAFAPAIEAAKEVGLTEDGDGERKILPEKRPVPNFRIKIGKKFLCNPLDLSLRKKGREKENWLGRDNERDDRKRRAEYILRQSMENPQELIQL